MTNNEASPTVMDRALQHSEALREAGSPVAATRLERWAVNVSSLEGPDVEGISKLRKAHEIILAVTCPSEREAFVTESRAVMSEAFPTVGRVYGNIDADAHSDDYHVKVEFNAAAWFQTASDEEIIELAACGWGGDYPADAVADGLRDNETAELFEYLDTHPTMSFTNDTVGFECHVDANQARAWIAEYRPALLERLPSDVEEVYEAASSPSP